MRILGIETSCDETGVAVIDVRPSIRSGQAAQVRIFSNVIASQAKLHAKFGGVVPHLAKREHQKNLVPVLLQALGGAGFLKPKTKNQKSKTQTENLKTYQLENLQTILAREPDLFARMVPKVLPLPKPKIDAIAVTVGPGLAPALWVGVNFARALGYLWKKPLIPVNHLEGHIYTNLLPCDQNDEGDQNDKTVQRFHRAKRFTDFIGLIALEFPALCLIVSGGHTELVLMLGYGKYQVIGETLDDAAGEAFDKVAKMLGLGFPGGPAISAVAEMELKVRSSKLKIKLPRPMLNSKDFSFSFSGLKTAVLYLLRDLQKTHSIHALCPLVAREFQQAVTDVLVAKTVRAAKHYRVKMVMIGGGVAANKKLRRELGQTFKHSLPNTYYLTPDTSLTGDNALMIALAGYFNRNKKSAWRAVQADANLRLDRKR